MKRFAAVFTAGMLIAGMAQGQLALPLEPEDPQQQGQPQPIRERPGRIARPAPQAQENEVSKKMREFGENLYRQLGEAEEGRNMFLSPLSIHVALQLAVHGAVGETQGEMLQVLRADSADQLAQPSRELMDELARIGLVQARQDRQQEQQQQNQQPPVQLYIANGMWVDQLMPLRPEYEQMIRHTYRAEAAVMDFRAQPEQARQQINRWVEQQTSDRIENLLPERSIDTLTRLVLANAVYFKANWLAPFEEHRTQDRAFTLRDGQEVQVPTMHNDELRTRLFQGDGVTMVSLPYEGGRLEMLIVMPEEAAGLAEALKHLAPESINRMQHRMIELYMPKFRMETEYRLNDTLKAMGMPLAFDERDADFTGMTDSVEGEELHIKLVAHKAFVEVAEWGTEAAAATGIVVGVTSALAEPPPVVRIDRPFLFAIRDRETGAPLFLGQVMDPRQE